MRPLLVALLRWLAEALVRLYYPRRTVEGAEHVPLAGPTLYLANHPNGLLDPLVFRVATGHSVRFLAKSTLWGNPFGRLAMDAFRCLPVYRKQDVRVDEQGQTVLRNEETFARCRAELANGAELALYPEGTSHSDRQLRPLKSGAARIALSAAAEALASNGAPTRRTPLVVPAGSYYEDKAAFRSGVHLVIGAPIDLTRYVATFQSDEKLAIEQLTDTIRSRLNELVLQAETRELLAGVARVAGLTGAVVADDSPQRRLARTRELLAAYGALKASDPGRLEQVVRAARRYAQILKRLGVRDPWALEMPRVASGDVARSLVGAVLIFPAAVWGVLTSWVLYRLSGVVASRLTNDDDVLSTIKMIVGTAFLVFGWIGEAILLGVLFGGLWGLLALLAAAPAGYAALRLGETLQEAVEAIRHLGWLGGRGTAEHLGERRRRLAEEVASVLQQGGR